MENDSSFLGNAFDNEIEGGEIGNIFSETWMEKNSASSSTPSVIPKMCVIPNSHFRPITIGGGKGSVIKQIVQEWEEEDMADDGDGVKEFDDEEVDEDESEEEYKRRLMGAGSKKKKTKNIDRGNYTCGKCGQPKKGHVCKIASNHSKEVASVEVLTLHLNSFYKISIYYEFL